MAAATITEHEAEQVEKANATGKQPVVFVHGLWLLPSSWDRWAAVFKKAGYVTLTPGWPDDPDTVAEAKEHPEVFAKKSIGQIADHFDEVIGGLDKKPAIIGHSFGGLLTQILAGRGLSAATVAFDSAPFRGILPLPISSLKSGKPVLGNPANRGRAIPLTYDQFRYSFANTVSEDEAKQLYNEFSVPGSGVPLFQAASANLNPWTEAKVDHKNPDRGPMLIVYGSEDHVSPRAINEAIFKKQEKNKGVTELVEIEGASHGLTIDSTWRKVLRHRARVRRALRLMDLGLEGKVAVVTGAGKGIGMAVTRELAGEGATVVAGSRTVDSLEGIERVTPVAVDLAAPRRPGGLVARALEEFGRVDVLVNNVGAVKIRDSRASSAPATRSSNGRCR